METPGFRRLDCHRIALEAKLTEGDFQIQRAELVEQYRDFREIFECWQLPRAGKQYISYQLIRNVLAARALNPDFCTLRDDRRPDLIEDWCGIVRCIRSASLRTRCKVLTWQELSLCLPAALQEFLSVKYGIGGLPEIRKNYLGRVRGVFKRPAQGMRNHDLDGARPSSPD
jgi:hypothetical protein